MGHPALGGLLFAILFCAKGGQFYGRVAPTATGVLRAVRAAILKETKGKLEIQDRPMPTPALGRFQTRRHSSGCWARWTGRNGRTVCERHGGTRCGRFLHEAKRYPGA